MAEEKDTAFPVGISRSFSVGTALERDIAMPIGIRIKRLFSMQNLAAAAFFARNVSEIEQQPSIKIWEDVPSEHRWFVYSAVIMAFTAFENQVYEIYEKHKERKFEGLSEEWNDLDLLEKVDFLLEKLGGEKLDKGGKLFYHFRTLQKLRNYMVHAEPLIFNRVEDKMVPDESKVKKLEEDLVRMNFKFNPFVDENQDIFPMRSQSHGCAAWAVKTSETIIKEVQTKLGIKFAGTGFNFSTK